jgi:hypothetical protein
LQAVTSEAASAPAEPAKCWAQGHDRYEAEDADHDDGRFKDTSGDISKRDGFVLPLDDGNSTTAVPTSFRQRGAQVLDWLTELTGCTPSHSMYIHETRVHPHATARMCERSVRLRANLFETWSKQRDFELAQRPGTRHRRGDGQIARKTGGNLCR